MSNRIETIPKVSIIVPVYKTEDMLATCMDSLLSQTLQEIEIILVDDGSPDEAGKMCDIYLKDYRVKVIHKENGGLSSARNAGMQIAKGEYVGFVDSDDYVDKTMYEKMYAQIIQTKSDVCACAYYTVRKETEKKKHYFENVPAVLGREEIEKYLVLPLIGRNPDNEEKTMEGFVWRNLYKREIISSAKFQSEREYFAEDVLFNLDIYQKCKKACILNECLYFYKYNEASLSNRYRHDVRVMLENLLLWEKDYLLKNELDDKGLCRLYQTGIKFIIFSIQNLKKDKCPLNYKEKKLEVKRLLKQKMFSESLRKVDSSYYNWKMHIFIILCRLNQTDILLKLL